MKLSKKQELEIEIIKQFIPSNCMYEEITEKDITNYFEYSSEGKHKELVDERNFSGFNSLIWGKRWCERHIQEIWKEDLKEGIISIEELVEDFPKGVKEYLYNRLKCLKN